MTNKNIICKDLIKTDQIKGDFNLYFWTNEDIEFGRWSSEVPRVTLKTKIVNVTRPEKFRKYHGNHFEKILIEKSKNVLNGEYSYILSQQNNVLQKYNLEVKEIYKNLMELKLPKRFVPKIEEIKEKYFGKGIKIAEERGFPYGSKGRNRGSVVFFKAEVNQNFKLCSMLIKEQIISLLKQRYIKNPILIDKIVPAFEKLNQKTEGLTINEYCGKWARRIIAEMNNDGHQFNPPLNQPKKNYRT